MACKVGVGAWNSGNSSVDTLLGIWFVTCVQRVNSVVCRSKIVAVEFRPDKGASGPVQGLLDLAREMKLAKDASNDV